MKQSAYSRLRFRGSAKISWILMDRHYSADLFGSMLSDKQPVVPRTWAECVAGSMSDPVKRLRFLRAVAPLANIWGDSRRSRWGRAAAAGIVAIASTTAVLALLHSGADAHQNAAATLVPVEEHAVEAVPAVADVWLVEHTAASDVYSNGLRVDNTFGVANTRRAYLAFPVEGREPPTIRSEPAGIVFHGTESQQIPFEAGHNERLKKIGESLLDYVRRRRAYHFVIDRFGRVHRIVAEADSADHAGYSAWADSSWLYLNLNQSFFGVALETRTASVDSDSRMTAAQTRSAAMLTEMLRARYRIAASNCVTHAQVSVNPSNLRIGYHVDWASEFPFREIGLPDNYAVPLPSIWRLGFDCDPALRRTGLRAGIELAETMLRRQSAKARQHLHQEYREKLAAVRQSGL
jgi:hypothetical protein